MSNPLNYSANDWFYMKDTCKDNSNDKDCNENREAVNHLKMSVDNMSALQTKYEDSKVLYNRELLFMFNLIVGLGIICYYVYLNQSVLPSLPNPTKNMNSLKDSMQKMASNLSMRPPTA